MNPISNCKVKQQVDFCKYDELSFRFFFPQCTPPKKNPFKLKDRIKNFQPNGQENHMCHSPKSVHFEYFKPQLFEYWPREQTPTHKTKFLKLFLDSIQSGGEP